MDAVRVIHDREGQTLTVWVGDPSREVASEEADAGVIVMKDAAGHVLGVEILGYTGQPSEILVRLEQSQTAQPGL